MDKHYSINSNNYISLNYKYGDMSGIIKFKKLNDPYNSDNSNVIKYYNYLKNVNIFKIELIMDIIKRRQRGEPISNDYIDNKRLSLIFQEKYLIRAKDNEFDFNNHEIPIIIIHDYDGNCYLYWHIDRSIFTWKNDYLTITLPTFLNTPILDILKNIFLLKIESLIFM